MTTLIVIAKETIPGKVKTRLTPALTFEQAAHVAAAALADTFTAVAAIPFERRILAFDGAQLPAGAESFEVIAQCPGELDERLAAIFDHCAGPTILIGMDTPQVTPGDFDAFFRDVEDGCIAADAWFGPAADGGFWALGLAEPRGDLIRGVPMSRDDTGRIQLERLQAAGLSVRMLPTLTDVDTVVEARSVSAAAPRTRFAAVFGRYEKHLLAGIRS